MAPSQLTAPSIGFVPRNYAMGIEDVKKKFGLVVNLVTEIKRIIFVTIIFMTFQIKHPITGGIFLVAENDFPVRMNRDDAMRACQNLGNGWRLPSKEELKAMHTELHLKGKGNFKLNDTNQNRSEDDVEDLYEDFFGGGGSGGDDSFNNFLGSYHNIDSMGGTRRVRACKSP